MTLHLQMQVRLSRIAGVTALGDGLPTFYVLVRVHCDTPVHEVGHEDISILTDLNDDVVAGQGVEILDRDPRIPEHGSGN